MIRCTLLTDGSSDKTLLRIIKWALEELLPNIPVSESFAHFGFLRNPPKALEERIVKAIELWPCDILFIHRDGEQTRDIPNIIEKRKGEISNAVGTTNCRYVPIIPVKMMETWLLTDEVAILKAAGNTTLGINLPKPQKLESISNPKEQLYEYLRNASGLKGRRLESFNVGLAVHLVAEYTSDFSKLRELYAYKTFELELKQVLKDMDYLADC